MKPIVTGSLAALLAASLAANALLYLRYSTSRPLVTVGGQAISKKDYQDALDYQTQGAVLKKMVLADLVTQAAAKAGVTPTGADVDARVADIQRRAPQALPADGPDGPKMAAFRSDLQTDMALENLRLQGVTVTDAQVADFYSRHKAAFAVPTQVQTTMVLTDNAVDAAQAAGLLRQGIGLDIIARQPRLHVVGLHGFALNWQALPPAINQKLSGAVLHMTQGQVQTVPVGGKYILAVRANKSATQNTPPLAQIRPQVTRLATLERAVPAPVEIAKLYQGAKPQFAVAKYADYFADFSALDVAKATATKKTASLP